MLRSGLPVVLAGLFAAMVVGALLARESHQGIAAMFGVCYAPLAFINLALGLIAWVPLAFLEHHPQVGLGQTLVMMMLGFAWLGAQPAMRAQTAAVLRRHSTMFGLILALVGWISASLLWAGDLGAAANDFWYWLVAAAIAVVVATTLNTPRHLIAICGAFVLGAVFTVVVASVQGTASEAALVTQEAGRLGAGLQDPNYLAAGLVPAAALAAGLLPVAQNTVTKAALGVALIALAGGLVATGSRGGLVAAAIAVVAALVIARGRRLRIGSLVVLVIAVAGGWFVTSSPETLERVQEFEGGSGREDLWQIALRMAGDNPVLGVGTNNFAVQSADYVLQPGRLENVELIVDTPQVVHNAYLQQLAETGIIGLVLWLAVLGSAIAASWTAARRLERDRDTGLAALAQAVVVAQIGALGASIFLSNGYDKRLWILFALGPVLMTIAERRRSDGT